MHTVHTFEMRNSLSSCLGHFGLTQNVPKGVWNVCREVSLHYEWLHNFPNGNVHSLVYSAGGYTHRSRHDSVKCLQHPITIHRTVLATAHVHDMCPISKVHTYLYTLFTNEPTM